MSANQSAKNYETNETIFWEKITWLKTFLTISIVYLHCSNYTVYHLSSESIGFSRIVYEFERFCVGLFSVALPFFFAISGFLFYRNYELNKTVDKYKSRFKSLLIPYLAWNILGYFFLLFITNAPVIKNMLNMGKVNLNFQEWIIGLLYSQWDGVLWYVRNLIVYVLISPFLYYLLKNRKVWNGIVIIVISLIYRIFFQDLYSLIQPAYFVGAYIGINYSKKAIDIKMPKIGRCLFVAISLLELLMLDIFSIKNRALLDFAQIVIIILLWCSINKAPFKIKTEFAGCLFFIYAAHEYLLESIEKVVLIWGGITPVMALVDFLFVPIATIAVLYAVGRLFNKYRIVWMILSGNNRGFLKK